MFINYLLADINLFKLFSRPPVADPPLGVS